FGFLEAAAKIQEFKAASNRRTPKRSFPMGRHLLRIVLIALIVCAGQPGRGEPPAALVEALKDKDPNVRLQAAQLLVQMGEAKTALPAVEELLKAPQPGIRLEAAALLKRMQAARLAARLQDPDPSARFEAAQALWQMGGAAAKDATPALLELLK